MNDVLGLLSQASTLIKNSLDIKERLNENYKILNESFYYKDYTKHLKIFENGNGIFLYSFTINILNAKECDKIYRYADVSDDTKIFEFDKLENLMKTNIKDRCSKAGFWFESDNDFISQVVEFPWDENVKTRKEANLSLQELKWYFQIDTAKIENKRDYKFNYVISIPDMFPITDGKYDKSKETSPDYSFISLFTLDTKVNNCTYILSFEKEIKLTKPPSCSYYTKGHPNKKLLKPEIENNRIYQRYVVKCKNLKCYNNIEYEWDIR